MVAASVVINRVIYIEINQVKFLLRTMTNKRSLLLI